MTTLPGRVAEFWRADFLSPKHLARSAFFIMVLFAVAHAAGLRESTSILSGTANSITLGWRLSALLGLTYVLLYLGFVLLVPILLLAAILLAAWRKMAPQPLTNPEIVDESRTNASAKDPLRHLAVHNRSPVERRDRDSAGY